MKKMRIPILVCFAVVLIGLILGSFFDLSVSQGLGASKSNGFALGVAAIAPTLGFGALSIIGGAFIVLGLKKDDYPIFARVIFFILAVGCFGASTYFCGEEYFGYNGFYNALPKAIGFIIGGVAQAGFTVLGFFMFRHSENKRLWIYLVFMMAIMFIALVPGTSLLKIIFHRPRYRAIVAHDIQFYAWYQPFKDYKALIESGIDAEEFKSFPSGHTCESTLPLVLATFLPLLDKKYAKIQLPVFICAGVFILFVAFFRILAAAHFFSDVSMGAMLTIVFLFIGNEIIIHSKRLRYEESNA